MCADAKRSRMARKVGVAMTKSPTHVGSTTRIDRGAIPPASLLRFIAGIVLRRRKTAHCAGAHCLKRASIRPQTRVVYFETPVNPDMKLIDIAAVRRIVDQANEKRSSPEKVRIVVDNAFATPYCQRPLEIGADLEAALE